MTLYKYLSEVRHPEYDADYWCRIEALYAGGKKLLGDEKVMKEVFPKHTFEQSRVYNERCKRAVYVPYMGQLLDHTVAAVGTDPIKVDGLPTDKFYDDFWHDTSAPGSQRVPMQQFLLMQLLCALKFKRAWTHVELPERPETDNDEGLPLTAEDEEKLGLNAPYLCHVAPWDVLDWEYDDEGELLWVLERHCFLRRPSIDGPRNLMIEEYTRFDREGWRRWTVKYDPTGQTEGMVKPKPDDDIASVSGFHSFKKVPFAVLEMTDGMWFGNKAESLQREHFNKLSALSWGQLRTLFAFLYVKLAPPDPRHPVTEDINRDVDQTIGPGHIMRLADKDEVGYAAPPDVTTSSMAFITAMRDEMHGLLTRMAQSAQVSAAAQQQSGKSKQVQRKEETILFEKLGESMRDHCNDCVELAMLGRGDLEQPRGQGEEDQKISVTGGDSYDDLSFEDLIGAALQLQTLAVPSAEFRVLDFMDIVHKRFPGLDTDKEKLIEQQIRQATTQDQILVDRNAPDPEDDPEEEDPEDGGPARKTKDDPGAEAPAAAAPKKKGKRPAKKQEDA